MSNPFVVLKFGGTSVATAERWSIIRDVAKQRRAEGYTPVIVCSALSGVSNQLDTLLTAALKNKHEEHLETLLNAHLDLARNLGIDSGWLTDAFEPLRRVAAGAALIGEATPRMKASVMSMGELLSTRMGAFLQKNGVNAQWIDARDCMVALPTQAMQPISVSIAPMMRIGLGRGI